MDIAVRDAALADVDALVIGNVRMAKETEDKKLDAETLRRGITAVIEDPSKGRIWVAELDDQIVGQLGVTWEWSDWRAGVMWWIQSVYVDSRYRRRGIFSAMFSHVENLARNTEDCTGLRLYVERENTRAQETYLAHNMHDAGYMIMEIDFSKGS